MRLIQFLILTFIVCSGFSAVAQPGALATFEPPEGAVLVFVGQDNASVGANDDLMLTDSRNRIWNNGYVDAFGTPAGVTHYVYMAEDKQNAFGRTFKNGVTEGLNSVANWAAGDMCMRCYLQAQSGAFQKAIAHVSISVEFNSETAIASGQSDDLILELAAFLKEFSDVPFLLRIGYEFDGAWNNYDPEYFKQAFIRIVDTLRAQNVTNFATVMTSSTMFIPISTWDAYYPGDTYVDWVGYSFFDPNHHNNAPALEFARAHGKPVFIAEATPWKGTDVTTDDGDALWRAWFAPLFTHIEANTDVIKAVSYINADWKSQPMWAHSDVFEIDTRIQLNDALAQRWLAKMAEPLYVHQTDGTYMLIGFE